MIPTPVVVVIINTIIINRRNAKKHHHLVWSVVVSENLNRMHTWTTG